MRPNPQRSRIIVRDPAFDFSAAILCNWHPAGPQVSLFFAALSAFFPEGEKFFIRSVRYYAESIRDPALRQEVRDFIAQEAMHGREHREYNAALDRLGLPTATIDRFVYKDLCWTERHFSPSASLAVTIALEHFTATMASVLLREPRALGADDSEISRLWRWHAVEESEHKAVAFDVFAEQVPGWRGYLLRCAIMLLSSVLFCLEAAVVHLWFCHRAGCLWNLRGWAKATSYFWGSPGLFRRILHPWLRYFRPDFHPWQDDNRTAIEHWSRLQDERGQQERRDGSLTGAH